MITGADIVAIAESYLGVPFLHQGRDRNGIDCGGLLVAIARDLGILDSLGYVDRRDYPREPTDKNMMRLMRRYMRLVRGPLKEGYAMHFGFVENPHHVAIYTRGDMIHALNRTSRQRVMRHGYRGIWPNKFRGAYVFPGVEY